MFHQKSRLKYAMGIFVITSLCVGAIACGGKSKVRQMAENSDRIADYCITALKVTKEVNAVEPLTQARLDSIINPIEKINDLNRFINTSLKDIIRTGNADNVQVTTLLEKLAQLERVLDIFNLQVITGETNPRIKVILTAFYAGTKATIINIRIIYLTLQADGGTP